MLVGSVAALAHGRSRATQDFDLVFEATVSQLRSFVATLASDRFYVSEEAALEALRDGTLFNVLDMETGWKVDLIALKARPFSEAEFSRRREVTTLGMPLYVASVEDVILAKLEWAKLGGSERQVEDARQLVELHVTGLDRRWIERWVDALGVRQLWERIAQAR